MRTTVEDLIDHLKRFDPKTKVRFEAEVVHFGNKIMHSLLFDSARSASGDVVITIIDRNLIPAYER